MSKLLQTLDKDAQRNMPINQVMNSALMGERSALQDIRELGIDRVLYSYSYRVASQIRHLWYFRAYVDTVITYYLGVNSINRSIDTVHLKV